VSAINALTGFADADLPTDSAAIGQARCGNPGPRHDRQWQSP